MCIRDRRRAEGRLPRFGLMPLALWMATAVLRRSVRKALAWLSGHRRRATCGSVCDSYSSHRWRRATRYTCSFFLRTRYQDMYFAWISSLMYVCRPARAFPFVPFPEINRCVMCHEVPQPFPCNGGNHRVLRSHFECCVSDVSSIDSCITTYIVCTCETRKTVNICGTHAAFQQGTHLTFHTPVFF